MRSVSERVSRRRVMAGRIIASAAIILAVYGVVALVVMGRLDHLPEGVAMLSLVTFGFGVLAWLAITRQPYNPAAWIPLGPALAAGLGSAGWATTVLIAGRAGLDVSAVAFNAITPADLPPAAALTYQFVSVGAVLFLFPMLTLWLLLFPSGQFPSPSWRWVAWGAVGAIVALVAAVLWRWGPSSTVALGASEDTPVLEGLYGLLLGISAICVVSLVLRYRHSTGDARPQYRWVMLGTGALYFAVFVVDERAWQLLAALGGVTVGIACFAVAVTKYRLYDIDLVISRTVVYGSLAALITGVYVAVVVGLGAAFGPGESNPVLAITATAIVAVTFQPARRFLQRVANRLVYGRRATAYEVLSGFSRSIATEDPRVLHELAESLAGGTSAESASVWLIEGGELVEAACWPADRGLRRIPLEGDKPTVPEAGLVVPVHHEGELLGALSLAPAHGQALLPTDRQLTEQLAAGMGLALRNIELSERLRRRVEELRKSRQRLVAVQDETRRRLERDLHDGAQQRLVALKVKLALAQRQAAKAGASQTSELLERIAACTDQAIDALREFARGVYPPLLEAEGLGPALAAQARKLPLPVSVHAVGVGRHPREVEAAVYFCVLEGLQNVVKHAGASTVHVALRESGERLAFEVSDDGNGFEPGTLSRGSGLVNLKGRLDAIDGELEIVSQPGQGTTLRGAVPLNALAGLRDR